MGLRGSLNTFPERRRYVSLSARRICPCLKNVLGWNFLDRRRIDKRRVIKKIKLEVLNFNRYLTRLIGSRRRVDEQIPMPVGANANAKFIVRRH